MFGWSALRGCAPAEEGEEGGERPKVAVEVAPITAGTIRDLRTFTGTLESSAKFRAAAKVSGLVESVEVDLGDTVERGQVVAYIDDAAEVQSNMQARAELAVERASLERAESALALAKTEHQRAQELADKGLAPQQRIDETAAALRTAQAALSLARGQIQRAGATVELTRIRRDDAEVRAVWEGEAKTAVVARRHQDAGNTVQPGAPIVDVVVLDPIVCVMSVPERDYGRLSVGQEGTLITDAVPDATFEATIARIAPVFDEASRQATVELVVENPEHRLKPGAFAEVRLVLGTTEAEAIVPRAAVTRRRDRDVIFVLAEGGETVRMRPVKLGVREKDLVQVTPLDDEPLDGQVVVLGQHLLGEGSPVRVVDSDLPPEAPTEATETE